MTSQQGAWDLKLRCAVHDEHLQTDHPRSLALTIVDLPRNITASWRWCVDAAAIIDDSRQAATPARRQAHAVSVGLAMQDSMVAAVSTTARITPSQWNTDPDWLRQHNGYAAYAAALIYDRRIVTD